MRPHVAVAVAVAVARFGGLDGTHGSHDQRFDCGPLPLPTQRDHGAIHAELLHRRSLWRWRARPLQVGDGRRLDCFVGGARRLGQALDGRRRDPHPREPAQQLREALERDPRPQSDGTLHNGGTVGSRPQRQFLIQGGKAP